MTKSLLSSEVSDRVLEASKGKLRLLQAALDNLKELASADLSDEDIENELEVYQNMLFVFTGRMEFVWQPRVPRKKFGREWRELLGIAREQLWRMKKWAEAGYITASVGDGNKWARPENVPSDLMAKRLNVASCELLDALISVHCRGGQFYDPPEKGEVPNG